MKLLIADDHDLLRETLRAFLQRESDIIVHLAADFPAAIAMVESDGPFDLILLDLDMPGMNGIITLQDMKQRAQAPVGIISGTIDRVTVDSALDAGAAGFMPKTMSATAMIHAVRLMAAGEIFAPVALMTAPVPDTAPSLLTEREQQVLRYLADGYSNKEIGRALQLQEVTIKLHVKTLTQKLNAKNRTHAAVLSRDLNLT